MNSTLTLASGVLVGSILVYAYRDNIPFDQINEKIETYKEDFSMILEDLISLGKEVLERLYNIVYEIIQVVILKFKEIKHNFELNTL
ncbi:MAG: hypothetical protein ACK5HS_01285 [Mycoplasmatales bacterium]